MGAQRDSCVHSTQSAIVSTQLQVLEWHGSANDLVPELNAKLQVFNY